MFEISYAADPRIPAGYEHAVIEAHVRAWVRMNEELKVAYERASGNVVREGVVYDSKGHVIDEGFGDDEAIVYLLAAHGHQLDELVIEEKCSEASAIIQCGQEDMLDYLSERGWDRTAVALRLADESAED